MSLLAPIASEIGGRLLHTDPTTLQRLSELEGRVISLDFTGTDIHIFMFPSADGIRLSDDWDGEVDVHMTGKPSDLIKMGAAGKTPVTPGKVNVRIEGDLHVGQQFKKILDELQIDWEELLSQYIGDIAAHHSSNILRSISTHVRQAVVTTAQNASEYVRYEARMTPAGWRVEEFIDDVDKLREDVDRMSMRIDRLLND